MAIIPARGGSKGIPRKNLAQLDGKPLIAYTIEAAQATPGLHAFYVSTDDAEIAETAERLGAPAIRRPPELATDTAPTEPVLEHALATLRERGEQVDYLVLLQPTSPLRTAATIQLAIDKALETGCDSVVSVCPMQHYYLSGKLDGDRFVRDYTTRPRSQDMPHRYRENGAVYVTRVTAFEREQNRLAGDLRAIVMNPVESIDVDEPEDLELCEAILVARRRLGKDFRI